MSRSREERREEERRYAADVEYEVYRNGGNMDRCDRDRISDMRENGYSVDAAASRELRAQRPQPAEQCEEQHPEQQYPDDPEIERE